MGTKENLSAVYREFDSNLGGNISRIGLVAAVAFNLGAIGCGTSTNSSSNIEATPTTKAEQLAATQTSTPLIVKPTETSVPPTSTPTEVPKKPENILPEYSVYYGQMKQKEGNASGAIILADIPGYSNKLYVLALESAPIKSGRAFLFNIDRTTANGLETSLEPRKLTIELTADKKTLSGKAENLLNYSWEFQIDLYGSGKDSLIEAAKKQWASEIANDPSKWTTAPASILTTSFEKVELGNGTTGIIKLP